MLGFPETEPAAGVVWLAVLLHLALSVATSLVLLAVVHGWRPALAAAVGAVYGVFLYTVNFVVFAFWLPGLDTGRGLVVAFDYALYGVAAVVLYRVLSRDARGAAKRRGP